MDKVKRHEAAPAPAATIRMANVAPPDIFADDIPFPDDSESRTDWPAWVDEQIAGMSKHKNVAEHKRWSTTVKDYREQLACEDKELLQKLLTAYTDKKTELENK